MSSAKKIRPLHYRGRDDEKLLCGDSPEGESHTHDARKIRASRHPCRRCLGYVHTIPGKRS